MILAGVFSETTDSEYQIILSKLRSEGIEYFEKKNLGSFIGITIGEMGKIELYFKESDYTKGMEIIETVKNPTA